MVNENPIDINIKSLKKKLKDLEGMKDDTFSIEYTDEEVINARSIFYECYRDIVELIKYYLDIDENKAKTIAVWICGTYMHSEFSTYPYLFINAMRGSGKTRLLGLIKSLAWNATLTNNITEAVLFRTAGNGTIIIDENESIIRKEKQGLRELLNSGYKKGSIVNRMKKVKKEGQETQEVESFNLYTPIVMANINGMEEVLGDRCITILLEKSDNKGKTKLIEDFDENPAIIEIRDRLRKNQCSLCSVVTKYKLHKAWNNYISDKYRNYTPTLYTLSTSSSLTTLKEHELEICNKIDNININGRNLELFFPLITVSYILDDMLLDEFLPITQENINEKRSDEFADSIDVTIFEFIATKESSEWFMLSTLLAEFKMYHVPDDSDREWLNAKWFGRRLKTLNLRADSRRKSGGMELLLNIKKAKEKLQIFKGDKKNGEETRKIE